MAPSGTTVHRKLVRDRIPEIIRAKGLAPTVRTLDDTEHRGALLDKLHEEAEELRAAAPAEQLAELADLHEVLAALTTALGYTAAEVAAAAAVKRSARGGFTRRLWLEEVRT